MALQLISTLERQVFDLLGYMWIPILCNFIKSVQDSNADPTSNEGATDAKTSKTIVILKKVRNPCNLF